FFPQAALDQWISEDRVDLVGSELVIKGEGRKYRVLEGVLIIKEVSGGIDQFELVGKVKSVTYSTELGAEVLENSMVLGDLAYEVIPGFVGARIGSFEQHRAGSIPPPASAAVASDEDMLAQYLMSRLQ